MFAKDIGVYYSVIPPERNFAVEKERLSKKEAFDVYRSVETEGFKLVRLSNYPTEEEVLKGPMLFGQQTEIIVKYPVMEILYVR